MTANRPYWHNTDMPKTQRDWFADTAKDLGLKVRKLETFVQIYGTTEEVQAAYAIWLEVYRSTISTKPYPDHDN